MTSDGAHDVAEKPAFLPPWVASVWEAPPDGEIPSRLVGSAVLIDDEHLVTCRHVSRVDQDKLRALVVKFPHTRRWEIAHAVEEVDDGGFLDVALLRLTTRVDVPPAIVRSIPIEQITGRWRAYGFPVNDLDDFGRSRGRGHSTSGTVHQTIGNGTLSLIATGHDRVTTGFSGTGLWSVEHDAVVAIVDTVNREGNCTAIAIAEAVEHLRTHKALRTVAERAVHYLDEADWQAWSLPEDPAYQAHFGPRGRGVTHHDQRGDFFRGRKAELSAITTWLTRWKDDHRCLVLTGPPGSGKSAVLGRVVTSADPLLGAGIAIGGDAENTLAPDGSITIAVHAAGKDVYDITQRIALATRVLLDTQPHLLGAAIANRHREPARAVTVMIDAVDEAVRPHRVMNELIVPLQAAGRSTGSPRVLVGTRHTDAQHRPLFSPDDKHLLVLDLTPKEQSAGSDTPLDQALTDYVNAILCTSTTSRGDGEILGATGQPVLARRIAEAARGNFLVASLVAKHYARRGSDLPASEQLGDIDIETALETYLDAIPGTPGVAARDLLGVLAFARPPGWSTALWRRAAHALIYERLQKPISLDDLDAFATSTGAGYVLITSSDGFGPVYRLYHQELIDTLLNGPTHDNAPS